MNSPLPDAPGAPVAIRRWLMMASILAVAINLRPALTSLAPLLAAIQAETGLSASGAGLLTTLPVLCLGLFGPLAPWLARRYGIDATIAAFLLALALGCLLRAVAAPLGLFAGAIFAGASIGIIGVLVPVLLKREFPRHAAQLTGVYTLVLCLGAAIAAGLTVPIAQWLDQNWRAALAFWALPAVAALLVWCWQWLRTLPTSITSTAASPDDPILRPLWRDPLAWRVTLFMGLQSSLAYSVFGWLPLVFESRGLSPMDAGLLLSASVAVQLITALTGPLIATRGRDQRPAVWLFLGLTLAGLLSCLFGPLKLAWLWAGLLGLGQGGSFSVALVLIVLRSRDTVTAGRLSGMVQGVGYTIAAGGPLLIGILHDRYNDWRAVGILVSLIATGALWAGLGAGRRGYVNEP